MPPHHPVYLQAINTPFCAVVYVEPFEIVALPVKFGEPPLAEARTQAVVAILVELSPAGGVGQAAYAVPSAVCPPDMMVVYPSSFVVPC